MTMPAALTATIGRTTFLTSGELVSIVLSVQFAQQKPVGLVRQNIITQLYKIFGFSVGIYTLLGHIYNDRGRQEMTCGWCLFDPGRVAPLTSPGLGLGRSKSDGMLKICRVLYKEKERS